MTTIHDRIETITKQAALDAGVDPDSDARRELASHLFDLAAARAVGREMTLADVEAAWLEFSPRAIHLLREDAAPAIEAAATGAPFVPIPRTASWRRRFAAYLLDVAAMVATVVISALVLIELMSETADPLEILVMIDLLILLVIMSVFEARRGATPGKQTFHLRTVDAQGRNPSWVRALIITVPKIFPPLLALDTILGLLTGVRDRRRLTERLTDLRVIQVN
jgi:uncharacterized RDD family membrane protein YckC